MPTTRHSLAFTIALLAAPASAQTLTIESLVQGATARFATTAGTLGATSVLCVGFSGTGTGPCFAPGACLGLTGYVLQAGRAIVDGSGDAAHVIALPTSVPLLDLSAQTFELSVVGIDWHLTASNAAKETVASVASLGDDFEAGALGAEWTVLNPAVGSVTVTGGQLVLTPNTGGLPNMWFEDGEGLAVVRPIHGDFELTTDVRVHLPGDQAAPPALGFQLAGLLVRDPSATAPGQHEWCHIATGTSASQSMGVEWKETHASSSAWAITPINSSRQELRLLRAGPTITAWYRDVGTPVWTQLQTYSFPALGPTVEVGLMAYSNSATPQLVARFEHVSLAP